MTRRDAVAKRRRPARLLAGAAALLFLALAAVVGLRGAPADGVKNRDVGSWAPPGTRPLSDAKASSLVTARPETVPANKRANRYVPTQAQLAAFRGARNPTGQTTVQFNPLTRYVTGQPRIRSPSTDELIQWVSHKWGIPTDLIRAQLVVESHWRQGFLGDATAVPASWYERYPGFARLPGGQQVYQSLGISQVKWRPDGSVGQGTEPLRWKSTAFSLDDYAATIRYYYDGACGWCTSGYGAGQAWNSVGAWFSPQPWANANAQNYIRKVRATLAGRGWTKIGR